MSSLRCKIILDGGALAAMGEAGKESRAVSDALKSEKARTIVFGDGNGQPGISQLCQRLGGMVSEALEKEAQAETEAP